MIAHLRGEVALKTVEQVVIDVQGVGYTASIPLSTYYALPDLREPVTLLTVMHVREDAMRLFGFATEDERALFDLLISVSSIGPRLALNMLSSVPALDLQQAIASADVGRLTTIPGIGRKTAERVVLELQEKVSQVQMVASAALMDSGAIGGPEHLVGDVVSALMNLGYRRVDAEKAVRTVHTEADEDVTLEGLLKDTLSQLAR